NRDTGRKAENLAAAALEKKGYEILERNFSNKFGEIDIIAKDNETLVFVEVKAKKGETFGLPEEMINKGKLSRVRHMAEVYLAGCSLPCRIDVVAVVLDQNNEVVRLTHYENVY
ncbi:YraN family protein, partial [Candidatus Microgenomates bacterium]|nr:YraN family protein [Candidatus Microgenomates bacterium]